MADLRFENLTKRFAPGETAVDGADLSAAAGEIVVVLGPSGCGKTTLLRMAAGLETPTSGRVLIGGADVTAVPAHRRDVAMVFQGGALYPHLSLFENIAFPLRVRGTARDEVRRRVAEAASTLGLGELLDRFPGQVSGGQRRRAALARALVRRPAVFLLDEPLSELDAPLRTGLRAEVARLRGGPAAVLHVTHDQAEAMALADRLAVMSAGRLRQVGPPGELYRRPADDFVAGFLGSPPMNRLDGRLVVDGGCITFAAPGVARIPLPPNVAVALRGLLDRPVRLGFRPEDATAATEASGAAIEGRVECVEDFGDRRVAWCRVIDGEARFAVSQPASQEPLPPGATRRWGLPGSALHVFDPADGGRAAWPR